MIHVARALTITALLAAVACKGRDTAPAASGTESAATTPAAAVPVNGSGPPAPWSL